jgi:hypothetical protein
MFALVRVFGRALSGVGLNSAAAAHPVTGMLLIRS